MRLLPRRRHRHDHAGAEPGTLRSSEGRSLRRSMDLLVLVGVGAVAIVAVLVLLARLHPGTGADLLDWDPSERHRERAEREAEDAASMLAHHNRMRRERGLPEQTEDELAQILRDERRRSR